MYRWITYSAKCDNKYEDDARGVCNSQKTLKAIECKRKLNELLKG